MRIWRTAAIVVVFLAGAMVAAPKSSALTTPPVTQPAGIGCVVSSPIRLSSDGTIYFVDGSQKRAFRAPETFFSYGFDFVNVKFATPHDLALPDGPVMPFRDGTLVKSKDSPLVYLVSDGQKRGFESGQVFLDQGYSFANMILINLPDRATFDVLPMGPTISAAPNSAVSSTPVTVVTPNGGEQWLLGTTQTIRWSDANPANQTYSVRVTSQVGNILGYAGGTVGLTQLSGWSVGSVGLPGMANFTLPAGSNYYIQGGET